MNTKYTCLAFLLPGLIFLNLTTLSQSTYSLKAAKMTVDGTSTLHDWTSDVTKVELTGQFLVEGTRISQVKDVQLKIPVTSIKSTKGKTMDNKTWEAFKYEKNPAITYKLTAVTPAEKVLKSTGTLTMAGSSKAIDLEVTYTVLPGSELRLTGSHTIKLKDYKMDPPTAMMGTIKVGEEVTVKFDVTLSQTK